MAIDIVIADDHIIFREGLRLIIQQSEHYGLRFRGEACTGKELIDLVKKTKPDIALTDIRMPSMNGIEATSIINKKYPKTKCIGISMFDEEIMVTDMLKAGAMGYILKDTSREELTTAIITVYQGNHYLHSKVANNLSEKIFRGKNVHNGKVKLSEREIQVIKLICEGLTNREMAAELNLQVRTIESYREHILNKLDVRNTAQIVMYAVRNDLVK